MNAPTFQTRRGAAVYAASVGTLLQVHHGVVVDSLGVIKTAEGYEPDVLIDITSPHMEDDQDQATWRMLAVSITARNCMSGRDGDPHDDGGTHGVLSPRHDIEFWANSGRKGDPVQFIQTAYEQGEQDAYEFGRDIIELAQLIESGEFVSDAELRAQLVESGDLA
jgi:hypothetical protein